MELLSFFLGSLLGSVIASITIMYRWRNRKEVVEEYRNGPHNKHNPTYTMKILERK